MSINNVTVTSGALAMASDINKISADACNTTDDIHPQYNTNKFCDYIKTIRTSFNSSGTLAVVQYGVFTNIWYNGADYAQVAEWADPTYANDIYLDKTKHYHYNSFFTSGKSTLNVKLKHGALTKISGGATPSANFQVKIYVNGVLKTSGTLTAFSSSGSYPTSSGYKYPTFTSYNQTFDLSTLATNGDKIDVAIIVIRGTNPSIGNEMYCYTKDAEIYFQ